MNNTLGMFGGMTESDLFPYLEDVKKYHNVVNPNVNIPQSALFGQLITGESATIMADNKRYFLTPDKQSDARLRAQEEDLARRAGREPKYSLPTYSYKTESGEKFTGSVLGGGSYKAFGKGGYGPQIQEKRAARGENPMGPEVGGYDKEYVQRMRNEEFKRAETSPPTSLASPEQKEAYGEVARQRGEIKRKKMDELAANAPEGTYLDKYGYYQKDYSKQGYVQNRYGYWEKAGSPTSSVQGISSGGMAPQSIYSSYGTAYTNPYSTFGSPSLFPNTIY